MRARPSNLIVLLLVLLMAFLSGCGTLPPTATADAQVVALTEENQQLQAAVAQLRTQLEEIDVSLATTGFLEPQVIVEPATFAQGGETLENVLTRGRLHCGVNINAPGLGYLDTTTNQITGFDIDFCRAIAAAIFGDGGADAVELTAVTNRSRFPVLQAGDVDVLLRNTTWTLGRDAALGINFVGPTLYDGVGMMVSEDSDIATLEALEGRTVCVVAESTAEPAVTGYYALIGDTVQVERFTDEDSARAAYEHGGCAGLAGDKTSLVGQRLLLAEPQSHIILNEEMSREPLAPAVRYDDSDWSDIVNWVFQCTLNAEFLGVNQRNVNRSLGSEDVRIQRLLGEVDQLGRGLGLNNDFCYQVVAQIGSYADIYERHLGPGTPYDLPRGLNALYTNGGILYPLPFQ